MTARYVAFCSNMLHSPLPFGIQALRQGSVGCTRDIPIIPAAFAALIFADDAAQFRHARLLLTDQKARPLSLRGLVLTCYRRPPRIAGFSQLAGVSQVQRGPSNSPHRSTLSRHLRGANAARTSPPDHASSTYTEAARTRRAGRYRWGILER